MLALTSLASRPASSPNLHFLVLPPNPFQSLSATPQNLQSQNTNQLTITNTKTTKHEALTQPKKNLNTLSQQSKHLKISKPQNKTLTPSRKTPCPQTQALKLQNDHPKPKTTPKTRKETKSQIPSIFKTQMCIPFSTTHARGSTPNPQLANGASSSRMGCGGGTQKNVYTSRFVRVILAQGPC